MIGPPPISLSPAELGRLEIVGLPGPADEETLAVYRFSDTSEYLAEDDETAGAIREAFPSARILRLGGDLVAGC